MTTPETNDGIPDFLDRTKEAEKEKAEAAATTKLEPVKEYKFHPYADLFPMLDENSVGFKALVEDIEQRGQQEYIRLYEGMILDGRNRYRACQKLGLDIKTMDFVLPDPIGFVLSANLHRRHLNEGQRAMVAAKLTSLEVGRNQHTKGQGTSIDAAF